MCDGEGAVGTERKVVNKKSAAFLGKRHDNKIMKVLILLSINFVVITQAPKNSSGGGDIP